MHRPCAVRRLFDMNLRPAARRLSDNDPAEQTRTVPEACHTSPRVSQVTAALRAATKPCALNIRAFKIEFLPPNCALALESYGSTPVKPILESATIGQVDNPRESHAQ